MASGGNVRFQKVFLFFYFRVKLYSFLFVQMVHFSFCIVISMTPFLIWKTFQALLYLESQRLF